MTLRRQDMEPGTVVHVAHPRTGLPAAYGGEMSLDYVNMFTEDGNWGLFSPNIRIMTGENLVIVRRPRKGRGTPNLIRVRRGKIEGEVYWCELRASCEMGFKP
jgi:hypothetical protein